jgi:hypothetical protein
VATGQHEVCLRINFPENQIARYHCGSADRVVEIASLRSRR